MKFAILFAFLPAVSVAAAAAGRPPPPPPPPPAQQYVSHQAQMRWRLTSHLRVSGYLAVVNGSGYALGAIASSLNVFGEAGIVGGVAHPLLMTAAVPQNSSAFEIAVTNQTYLRLGAAVGFASDGPDLTSGSANYAVLTAVPSGA
jgi:hypothetical protein